VIYNEYGNSGKKVSAIGFGGMRFIADEYKKDVKISAQLVLAAHEKGITYFDTAPGYCNDKSEEICGEAFKQMKYGDFYVSTKCGLWNATDADGARRMIEQSLKRLNVPKITFYNMWCIKSLDEYRRMTAKGGMYEGILKARDEGLIEHICCTTHTSGAEVEEIIKDGLVEGVTLGYNAINFAYRRKGIQACHAANKGVVVMNPLGGGTIPQHPDRFAFLSKEFGGSVPIGALKFLVAHKEITVTLPGFATAAQLDDAIAATTGLPEINEAYLEELSKKLGSELDTLCTNCAYCDECPADVPVPKLLEAYNEFILTKDMSKVTHKLGDFWGINAAPAKNCTACGVCEKLCTQKLPIIERLKQLADQA